MAYRLELTERAARDLEHIYRTIRADAWDQAYAWFNKLERLILSLDQQPGRGALVPEDAGLRQLLHGRKPNVYRVIYEIDEPAGMVTVLHIRHGRRGAMELPSAL